MTPAQSKIKDWRNNVAQFAYENFKFEPDEWQKELFDVFPSQDPDKIRISLQACVGPGKTAIEAVCGWNFLSCYGSKGHHPKGAAVSVTAKNLADNLWPEFSKWQSRSPFLMNAFEWTKTRIFAKDHPETWFFSARAYSKTANAEEQGRTLSGLHSDYVMVIIDESGDIPVAVGKAAEQAASNKPKFIKILQAGNPSSLDGLLYAAASSLSHLWYHIVITGDPNDPKRSPRIDIDWARQQIETYGRDNPWLMYSLLGKFPPSSINSLLSPDDVNAAMGRTLPKEKYEFKQKRLGIDVADSGPDRTVIFPRQGQMAFQPVVMRTQYGPDIAARVLAAKKKWGSEMEIFDDTGGWAGSAMDSMTMAGQSPIGINFAGKALDPRFYNQRAEIWWNMADAIKKGLCLPKIGELVGELSTPTYTIKNGKFLLEPKELIKKRLGRSPDLADALALTFGQPEAEASLSSLFGIPDAKPKYSNEYDPYADDRPE